LDSSAGDIFGPTPVLMANAPPGAPLGDQRTREVRFSIRADGRVTRIEVIPPIKDSRYQRVFMKAMQDLAFSPVKTRDGRAIDYVYSIVVHP
jgi:outer membrane biosynthesis protein TonB